MSDTKPTSAGRELDRFIAEKVFGLVPCRAMSHTDGTAPYPCYAPSGNPALGSELQTYSANLEAAWAAAEKANLFANDCRSLIKNKERLWEVRDIDYQAGDWDTLAVGKTVPEALCLAILAEVILNSAPAAPPENSGPTLVFIDPLVDQVFKGKSLVETMQQQSVWHDRCDEPPLTGASDPVDAGKQGKKTPIAPAARTEFSKPIKHMRPNHKSDAKTGSIKIGKPVCAAAPWKSTDAKKQKHKKASAPAASTRISKRKKK